MKDLIVNLCPTGMVPTKEMTPHVPTEPKEVIEDVLACAEIGVTMVHLHARDKKGIPTWDPDVYAQMIDGIRKYRPDLVLIASTSGRTWKEIEKRSACLMLTGETKPDGGSLTTSSLNFARQDSMNAPETVQGLARIMLEKGIFSEVEAFDAGMVNYMKYLIAKGFLKPPFYTNLFFGNIATAQANFLEVGVMTHMLPPHAIHSFAGIGDAQLPINTLGIAMADGVRVGVEDNIWYDLGRTKLATNRMLIQRVKNISEELGRPIMKSIDLRHALRLHTEKGKYGVSPETK